MATYVKITKQALDALEARVAELERENQAYQEAVQTYKTQCALSADAYNTLLQAFKQLQRQRWGSRSERFVDDSPSQWDLFSTVPACSSEAGDADNSEEADPREGQTPQTPSPSSSGQDKKKKRRKRRPFGKGLTRRIVIIPVDKPEEAGVEWRVIRYEDHELFHYVPPVYEVIVERREVAVKVAVESNVRRVITAPRPKHFLPKAKVSSAFLSHVIVSKLRDRQPLYHLEQLFKERFDFHCGRHTLARWFIDSAQALQCLVNLIEETVMGYEVASCDPTTIQVLNEPGRSATTTSYMFTLQGGPPEKPAVVYRYNALGHKAFLREWFADYTGYLHVDGQNIFDELGNEERITLLYCNSHARRKFEPIAKASKQPGLATHALQYYKRLYEIERIATQEGMTPEERHAYRQSRSVPLVDAYDAWVLEKTPLALPASPLGKALSYVSARQAGLRRFLDDGRLSLDTNGVERKNQSFALPRKNFLFSHSVDGAQALGNHMTLIQTAMANGLEPYQYYVTVMDKLPYCTTLEEIEGLLPWSAAMKDASSSEASSIEQAACG